MLYKKCELNTMTKTSIASLAILAVAVIVSSVLILNTQPAEAATIEGGSVESCQRVCVHDARSGRPPLICWYDCPSHY